MSFLDGWPVRKSITIKPDHITETLYNFPLCVKLNDADVITSVQEDGRDLRFTLSDGVTLLHHELDGFSVAGATASGNVWVSVPEISGSDKIYMYWGNDSVSDIQCPTGVWDNYLGVWHLNTSGLNYYPDSTKYGLIARRNTDKSSQSILNVSQRASYTNELSVKNVVNTNKLSPAAQMTIESWIYEDGTNNGVCGIANKIWGVNNYRTGLSLCINNRKLYYGGTINDVQRQITLSPSLPPTGTWYHACISYDNATSGLIGYINGEMTSGVIVGGDLLTSSYLSYFQLGYSPGQPSLIGLVDEVRVSPIALTSGWIHFQYNNIASEDNELIFGTTEGNLSGVLPLYLKCEWTPTSGLLDTYIHGYDDISDNINLYLLNIGNASGDIDLFTHGYADTSGLLDFYLACNFSSGDLSLYTLGHELSSGNLPLYTIAHISAQSGLGLFIRGLDTGSGLLDLYSLGHETSSGLVDFYTLGHSEYSVAVPLFLKSDIPGYAATLPLFLGNYSATVADYIELYIKGDGVNEGFTPYSKSVPLIIGRNESLLKTLPIYLKCIEDSPSGLLDMYICGAYLANSGLDLITKGCDTLTGKLGLYTHGY